MSSLQEARNLAPRVLSLICSYAQGKLLVQCSSFVQTTVEAAVALIPLRSLAFPSKVTKQVSLF